MILAIPVISKIAFGPDVTELCSDLEKVINLLQSDLEIERAGAVALLATQFNLTSDAFATKVKDLMIGEKSNMVNAHINLYLPKRKLFLDDPNIVLCSRGSLQNQIANIQNGSKIEKLGALLYAQTNYDSNRKASLELCQYALNDVDNDVRVTAMFTFNRPHFGTANKEIASIYARISLDKTESDEARSTAAFILLWIFGDGGPRSSRSERFSDASVIEIQKAFYLRLKKLTELGIDGIDIPLSESLLSN